MTSYQTKYATIFEDENEIIHIVMNETFVINEEDAKDHVESCLKIADGVRRKVLFDVSKVSNLTNAGMKKLFDPRLAALTTAVAVLVGMRSPLVSVAISFLLKLDHEPFLIKTFSDKEKALEWLKSISAE